MSELLPTEQAQDLRTGLLDYLTTTFALADQDARIALREFLTDTVDGIFKGPFLRLRLPFRPADDGWQQSVTWTGPGFIPYRHQAEAFARLTTVDLGPAKPRPLPTLVTTGTGSGKTESFLYPILEHVLRERRAGRPGLKALLLYPMNALANDQAKRLATLLTTNEDLKGITAGLYTGQQVDTRTSVTEDGLINDRYILRDDPPDILLTNYKMLDQLLLRRDDQPLWEKSARSLRYLVLDEFHTYDGAQGTDVAMLLRRLGLALKSYWLDEDPSITDAERSRPLGMITPVATSATLGDQGDPAAMVEFARTVFGEDFDASTVVTESRLSLAEWVGDAADQAKACGSAPSDLDRHGVAQANRHLAALLDAKGEPGDAELARTLALRVLATLYGTTPEAIVAAESKGATLLILAKAHPLVQRLLTLTADAVHLDDLADRLYQPSAGADPLPPKDRRAFLTHLIGMLSHVRAITGRAAATVEAHLWVRELTRVDRVAASTPKFLWSDDGTVILGETHDPFGWEGRPAFPAVYCRHCGRSGWGVGLAATGSDFDPEDGAIRRNHAAREGRFRALLYAPAEADHDAFADDNGKVDGLRWFAVKQRTILSSPPPDDDPDFRDGWVLPVLTLTGADADDRSRDDTCPSCLQKDAIRFLGSAIATLLSVTLSTMFGDPALDTREKKALVFTDSVQDAAHRAGFVQSRSHTLTLRSVFRAALGDGPTTLDELVEQVLRDAGDDPFRRYRLIPPDLAERDEFKPFWSEQRRSAVPIKVRSRVKARLLFDAVLEFGLQSRIGRTLEATGSVVAEVSAASGLAAIARPLLTVDDGQQTLDAEASWTSDEQLTAWVRGVLEHLRERGAVMHPWFGPYIKEDGSRYRIWGGRPKGQGMPAFPKGRSAPAFARIGKALPDPDPLLDPVTSSQSWYARWTARTLGVSAQHGARLARALLERLAKDDVLQSFATTSGATVYAVPTGSVVVAPADLGDLLAGKCLLECDTCRTPYPGTPLVVDQLAGAPCLLVRCPGTLRRARAEDNYYRTLYASSDPRRIVAREHSSVLDDETRVRYETEFKAGQADPSSPNVLVATPTLEMGIDIGDLSAVLLASLPRTVASYLQRVGRAGRLTGNALNLAFVTGRGEHLPRLGDPLSVVNGQVRPPATYLSAEEILQRQYVAHLVDRMARDGIARPLRRAADVLGSTAPGSFLAELVALAEGDAPGHLDRFLGTFDGLAAGAVTALRAWAAPGAEPGTSGLGLHLSGACTRWAAALEELRHREKAIQQSLPGLTQVAELPAATDDDKRAARSAQAALKLTRAQAGNQRDQFWVQALEEYGVLPNYTLLDDTVDLDVAMTWIDPETQEFNSKAEGYRRPSRLALRDFAPGAVFYGRGLEIQIDSVDLGFEGGQVRPWAFCPDCGYAVDRAAKGTLSAVPACPRCGGTGVTDTKQHLDVVELTRVSAEIRRDEATITDRRDERARERFTIFVAADVDPASVTRQWYVDGYDFGLKYLRRMDIRWLNAGRSGGYGAATCIAGAQRPATLFRVCSHCGKLDRSTRTNRPDEHRPWCRYRKAAEENTRTLALMRTLSTQGVVLRLPASVTIGDVFAVPSLSAALLLGLHEHLGGSPDHLDVVPITDPTLAPGGGVTREALLVHDVVPGGTGYLAELADPARLWDLLYRAWTVVRDCACADEPRLACHRCLLPYAGGMHPVDRVSRQAAERHLRAILTSGYPDGEPPAREVMGWALTEALPGPGTTESHLEQSFRKVFRERVTALGATVQEIPGAEGNRLRLTFPGAQRQWSLDPQVLLHGSRPDFVLRCNDPDVPQVAIFADGRHYHASPGHNRIADDAAKRRALRDQGLVVLAVTARDVDLAAGSSAAGGAPSWFSDHVVASVLESGQFSLSTRTVEAMRGGPFAFLMTWLQKPFASELATFADLVPLFFLSAGSQPVAVPDGDLSGSAASLLAGDQPVGESSALWWRDGHLGVLARAASHGGGLVTELAVVLDDRDSSLAEPGHDHAWRAWLELANALNLRTQPGTVTCLSLAATGETAPAATLPAPRAAADDAESVPSEWAGALEQAMSPLEARALGDLARAGVIPVPEVGYESPDGIMVDFAWPDYKVAAYVVVHAEDKDDLERAGWRVVAAEVDAVTAALASAGGVREGH